MGKVEDVAALTAQNPRADPAKVVIYADALADYRAAQSNIDEHGAIVFHPRTGAPIPNPYLVVRDQAARRLVSLGLRSVGLWGSPG